MKGENLVFFVISLIFAIFAALNVGLTWSTLNSLDVCVGQAHQYVYGLGIVSAIQLTLYLLLMTFSSFVSVEVIAVLSGIVLLFMLVIGGILSFVWFIWGIIILANEGCVGTIYNTMTIVFTVLSGLACIGSYSMANQKV